MDTITAEQLRALRSYRAAHGRYWKRELNHAWMTGDYWRSDDSTSLQQLRNAFGPSWLERFSLDKYANSL